MASITFTPIVLAHHKRRDGAYNVKIRLTFKRKSAYFATSIMAYPSDLTKNLELKSTGIKLKAHEVIKELNAAAGSLTVSQLESLDINGVCEHIRRTMNPERFRLDFLAYSLEQADKKSAGTASGYRYAIAAVKRYMRYIGRDSMDISEVTVKFLRGFEDFLTNEPNVGGKKAEKGRKVSQYLAAIQHMHTLARREFNEPDTGVMRIPINPFDYYDVPSQKAARHRNKDVGFVQKMINTRQGLKGRERLGVDVFLISLALMGMNAPDMYELMPARNGVFVYNRRKTRDLRSDGAEHHVKIEPCIKPLIDEYADPAGERAFDFHTRYSRFHYLTVAVNVGLAEWAKNHNEDRFSLYSARHTFATLAHSAQCGVDKYTVDECLCHSSTTKIADIYIQKDWEVLFQANRKVLSLFDWTPLQKV